MRSTTRSFLVLLSLVASAFCVPCPAETFVPADARRFEFYGSGLQWWRPSSCDFEVGGPGRIVTITDRDAPESLLVADGCYVVEADAGDVVRSGSWIYYFSGGVLSRGDAFLRFGVDPVEDGGGDPIATLPAGLRSAPLALRDGTFYWSLPNRSGGSTIWRAGNFGAAGAQSFGGVSGTVERIVPISYETSPGTTVLAVVTLTTTGELWITRQGARLSARLSGNVRDVHVLERRTLAVGGLRNATIYAARGLRSFTTDQVPPGDVVRFDARTGDETRVFQCQGSDQAIAVTTDPAPTLVAGQIETRRVWVTVGEVGCTGGFIRFCSIQRTKLYRGILPGVSNGAWTLVDSGPAASFGNLRSDGDWIYFLEDTSRNGRVDSIGRLPVTVSPYRFDFTADGLEVVQAIQTFENEIPLLADREGTWVRGYARYASNREDGDLHVTATLRAFVNGAELPGSPFPQLNSPRLTQSVDLAPRRADESRTYLFRLPPLPRGTLRVEFTVDPRDAFLQVWTDPDPRSNDTVVRELPVQETAEPCLQIISPLIHGLKYTFQYNLRIHDILDRAATLLPVEGLDAFPRGVDVPSSVTQAFDAIDVASDASDDQTRAAYRKAIEEIAAIRECSDNPTQGCADDYWVIALHPNIPATGWAGLSWYRRVIVVLMNDALFPGAADAWSRPRGGVTLAHELGHEYGRKHIDCGDPEEPDTQYPYPTCWIDHNISTYTYGFDPIARRAIAPETAGDVMSYADAKWISDYTWGHILAQVRARGGIAGAPGDDEPWVLVRGAVDLAELEGTFGSFWVFAAGDAPSDRVAESVLAALDAEDEERRVEIRAYSADGALLERTALLVTSPPDEDPSQASFIQYVPWHEDTARFELRSGGARLAELRVSANAPAVDLFPVETAGDVVAIRWNASDADGDALRSGIWFSPDDGTTWRALALDRDGFGFATSTALLPAANRARLRVIVSDGVHTQAAISERFTIAPHAPSVEIAGVDEGARLEYGVVPTLRAAVVDPDEDLAELAHSWAIVRPDGVRIEDAGSADTLTLELPTPGNWTVELRVTDPTGRTGTAERTFEVLPLLVDVRTAPDFDGLPADSAYGSAPSLPLGSDANARAWITRTADAVYVAASGLSPIAIGGPVAPVPSATILFDADGSRATFDGDEFGVRVNLNGVFEALRVVGGDVVSADAHPELDVAVEVGPGAWSFEARIPAALFANWTIAPRLLVHASRSGAWPAFAASGSPAAWGRVRFADEFESGGANRPPVALAGPDDLISAMGPVDYVLSGASSSDPDGDPLTFRWRLLEGEAVDLRDAQTAGATVRFPRREGIATYRFELRVRDGDLADTDEVEIVVFGEPDEPPEPSGDGFRRGDANASGEMDIADAIFTLSYLFTGGPAPTCLSAADANDDGEVDISDALSSLGFLFLGVRAPPAPFPGCGEDRTPDGLDCVRYDGC